MLQKGTRLNDTYTLMEQLGSGGGGIVYKAYHERLQTTVVVKQIRESVKGILESRAEADILKNIKHTRLPRVYDFLELDGEIYTVMDYIPGESMDKVLRKEGHFRQEEVLKWALQLADALAYLHSQDPPVVHSDIKPANVMLTPERDICLIDFNISLAFDKGMRTSTGISRGYSPPEQYQDVLSYCGSYTQTARLEGATEVLDPSGAEALEQLKMNSRVSQMMGRGVDERSDIYSLGATLYHFLTGRKPEQDFDRIVPISACKYPISEGLRIIIQKMMELEPANRYQNGKELLYALNHIHELDSEYQAKQRKIRRKKLLISALAVSGIMLSVSGWELMKRKEENAYYQVLQQAKAQMEKMDYDQAEAYIQEAQSMKPDRIEAYEQEILRLYSIGQYQEAIQYGQQILMNMDGKGGSPGEKKILGNLYYVMGNAQFEEKHYQEAIQCFDLAIQNNQENSLFYRDKAIAMVRLGQTENAGKVLDDADGYGLGDDSIYMVQGEIAFSKNENETALKCLEKAIQAAESQDLKRKAVSLYAQTCQKMGEKYLNQEITCLEQAKQEFSTGASMHISEQLADAYARKAKSCVNSESAYEYYDKALKEFSALYEQGYATRQMMENISVIYQQIGEFDKAETMLLQMLDSYPEDYRAYKRLALLEADRQQNLKNPDRNYQRMKEYYEQAVRYCNDAGDTEMQMLEVMMRELKEGGWFE